MSETKWQQASTGIISTAIIIVLLIFFYITFNKTLFADEMESISAATLIFDGNVPYKDFWQIHTPLFYYLLVPLCFFFKSMKIIYAARLIVFFLFLLNGYLIYLIIKLFLPKKAALLGALSYFASLPVLNILVRPDALVALFSSLSLWLLLWPRWPVAMSFFLSGFSAALALLSKQSGSFCIMSIMLFFIVRSFCRREGFWDKEIFSKDRFNIKNYCFFAAGLLLPCLGFYLLLVHQGALNAFWQCAINNDFLNSFLFLKVNSLHWSLARNLKEIFLANAFLFLSAAVLFFYVIFCRKRVDPKKLNAFVIAVILYIVSFGALFRILHPWDWEFLLSSQYLVLLAVPVLFSVYEAVFIFFKRKNKGFLGVLLNSGMLMCLCLPPVFHAYKTTKFDLPASTKRLDLILSLTNKNDKCCSVMPVPFRPSVYFYHVGSVLVEAPQTDLWVENTLINEILHDRVVVIVPSTRYDRLRRFMSLVENNYIESGHPFYVPGRVFNARQGQKFLFNVLVDGHYRIHVQGEGIQLDGNPMGEGVVYLNQGKHSVSFSGDQGICWIFYDFQSNKKGP